VLATALMSRVIAAEEPFRPGVVDELDPERWLDRHNTGRFADNALSGGVAGNV
jgi:hypothetical protein